MLVAQCVFSEIFIGTVFVTLTPSRILRSFQFSLPEKAPNQSAVQWAPLQWAPLEGAQTLQTPHVKLPRSYSNAICSFLFFCPSRHSVIITLAAKFLRSWNDCQMRWHSAVENDNVCRHQESIHPLSKSLIPCVLFNCSQYNSRGGGLQLSILRFILYRTSHWE